MRHRAKGFIPLCPPPIFHSRPFLAKCLPIICHRHSIRLQSTDSRPNYLPLSHFMPQSSAQTHPSDPPPYLSPSLPQTYYIEPYGCQMNFSDSDLINSILQSANYIPVSTPTTATIILLVTCAIRENAESKIWRRLETLQSLREKGGKVALLGCMAERLKYKLLEKDRKVDVVCGPDGYRDLPSLLARCENGEGVGNVMLSVDETYADIMPVQIESGRVSGCVSIMRGCNNMCTYCIVPFTRGISLLSYIGMETDGRTREIETD